MPRLTKKGSDLVQFILHFLANSLLNMVVLVPDPKVVGLGLSVGLAKLPLDVLSQIVEEVPDLAKTGLGLSLAEFPLELVPDTSKESLDFRNFSFELVSQLILDPIDFCDFPVERFPRVDSSYKDGQKS